MGNLSQNTIEILQFLLPGFVTAWVFYGFSSYTKPSQFERVIQALIFTIFVRGMIQLAELIGNMERYDFLLSIVCSVILGFVFAFFANSDKFHWLIRKLNISSETSYASEWFGTFRERTTYVVLHLNDERRLYGWPREWPSDPSSGHFLIEQASWLIDLDDNESDIGQIELTGVECIIINAQDVKWVEFMKKTWEKKNDKKGTKPAGSNPNAFEEISK
jgi:Family of unknown function (DUF6338)